MKLNLAKKNILSDKNLQDIIRIGVNFGEKINQITDKCVEDYKEDTLYSPKMLCIYDNYIWECKYSTQGAFDNTKWTKLTDELSLIELDDIKAMLNLTDEQLKTLSSLILDSEIRLDKTFSSSRIYSDIQQCLNDSKTFTLQELAKKTGASYKIVTNTTDMTSTEYLYLLANANNAYDIYALIDGTAQKIGDTTIDLSQFYTKTEIDNDFLKKTDADSKFATITTVDGKVDKTSILTTISSTPSDDKLLSEKAINDTLVKKTDIDNKVDKTDIVSVLDSTVTNKQLIDGKTLVDKFNSIEDNLSRRYNFDDKKSASIVDRKLAIKAVINSLKKDGTTDSSIDYYGNNLVFLIRYNGGYYYSYIMTSYMSKVFIQEYSPYATDVNFWLEDEMGELYIRGTIPMVKDIIRIVNPFTTNKDKYKLYDGKYTIDEKTNTCTLTISIDCLSPASLSTDVGSLNTLNFKAPSSPSTFDLQSEKDSTSTIKFYLGVSVCQIWGGTAGKRYTGTITYRIK